MGSNVLGRRWDQKEESKTNQARGVKPQRGPREEGALTKQQPGKVRKVVLYSNTKPINR